MNTIETLQSQLNDANDRIVALEKEAARYRAIRDYVYPVYHSLGTRPGDPPTPSWIEWSFAGPLAGMFIGPTLDEAIDAKLAKAKRT